MLVGVKSLQDCEDAVKAGATWLKVYPVSKIPIDELTQMCLFVQNLSHCRISLSGGIDSTNIVSFHHLHVHDILKGYDLDNWSIKEICDDLISLRDLIALKK